MNSLVREASELIAKKANSVVFVTTLLRAREIKMATALRHCGWTVVLLYKQTTPIHPENNYDIAIRFDDDSEIHRVAKELQAPIYHLFSGAIDELTLNLCRDKPGRVVVDLNDIFCPSLFNYLEERFNKTKECLALADALCCRDLQPKFADRFDNFTLPRHILLFPEYSWTDGPAHPNAAPKKSANELHVASVGTFTVKSQGMADSSYFKLAQLLADQKIHLHIYPHWFYRKAASSAFNFSMETDLAEYLELERRSPYLHLHESLPHNELARELTQYDFGIISGGSPELGQELSFLTTKYMASCYSGRISDYLDARLPILINKEVAFNYWLLDRYGIAVDLGEILKPGFRDKLLSIKQSPRWANNVSNAAANLSLNKQAARLGHFYDKVIQHEAQKITLARPQWFVPIEKIPQIGRRFGQLSQSVARANNELQIMRRIARTLDERNTETRTQAHLDANRVDHVISQLTRLTVQAKNGLQLLRHTDNAPHQSSPNEAGQKIDALLDIMDALRDVVDDLRNSYQRVSTAMPNNEKASYGSYKQLAERNANLTKENSDLRAKIGQLRHEVTIRSHSINDISGLLNWPEITDDIKRNNGFLALVKMLAIYANADNPSSAWEILNQKNLDQILKVGYDNFKRTIAFNFFTFPIQAGDAQLSFLESNFTRDQTEERLSAARAIPDDPNLTLSDQATYRYFVMLLWKYAQNIDALNIMKRIAEPNEGNPILVSVDGQNASQDLANSVLEYYSMTVGCDFDHCKNVLEIGGGYGRNAFVIANTHLNIRYVCVDIPPALYVAQRYLSTVFPDRQVFRAREFATYDEVKEEIESASIVFLFPHQLQKLPAKQFDLTINISSFGEMTNEQVEYYFSEVDRLTTGVFYSKQWQDSKNPFDQTAFNEESYPYRPTWRKIYSRPCAVQVEFFESLYLINANADN